MKTVCIIFCTLLVISIAVAGIIFFVSPKDTGISDKEKKAAFTKILGRTPLLTEKIRSNAFVPYHGKYLTFMYPVAAKQYPNDEKIDNTTIVERFEFQETDDPRYHFFTQVEMSNASQYDDVSGVRLRRLQHDIYTENTISSPGGNWVTFIKNDDMFEKTAFLLNNGKLYTFSITGSDPAIEKIFDTVVSSVSIIQQ